MKKAFLISVLILRWVLFIVFLLIVLLFVGIEIFDRYMATERGANWTFKKVDQPKSIHYTSSGVRYVSIGDTSKPALLLIHGAPGTLIDWGSIASRDRIYDTYRLLILERPGYGATKPRGADRSILSQAKRFMEIVNQEKQPVTIMGHSYGATIAAVMGALSDTTKIRKIYAISGQYDPDNEIVFKVSYVINFKIFKYLLPRFIWSSNVEKMTHQAAQKEVLGWYSKIIVPIDVVHGDADTLVPYENAPFLMQFLKNNPNARLITLPGKDHPLQMQAPDLLVDMVLE